MSTRQKTVTISHNQIKDLESGRFGEFAKNMITLGASISSKNEEITSITGPYHSEKDGSLLIINFKGDGERAALVESYMRNRNCTAAEAEQALFGMIPS